VFAEAAEAARTVLGEQSIADVAASQAGQAMYFI
jgi:hypothetical protein